MRVLQRIYKKLAQKSRLDIYKGILQLALDKGYRVCSIYDWYRSDKHEKVLVLRHDVDIDVEGARKMFEVERHLGVSSTYYFRNTTKNHSLIKKMQSNGFEVGLHYETIADYCKIKGIKSVDDAGNINYRRCALILEEEIENWKNEYGDLKSICAHGDKRNRILHIPNRILFDDVIRSKTSVFVDACDKDLMEQVDVYISDTSVVNNHRWKYGVSPIEAINRDDKTIMLLTHPTHWNYNFLKGIKALYKGFKEDSLNYVYKKERLNKYL